MYLPTLQVYIVPNPLHNVPTHFTSLNCTLPTLQVYNVPRPLYNVPRPLYKFTMYLARFTMYHSHILLILRQEVGHILAERFYELEGRCVVIFERVVRYLRESLVIVRSLSFFTPERISEIIN
jgi:hypothetical protein